MAARAGIAFANSPEVLQKLSVRYPLLFPCCGAITGILLAERGEGGHRLVVAFLTFAALAMAVASKGGRRTGAVALVFLGFAWLRAGLLLTPPDRGLWERWIQDKSRMEVSWRVEEFLDCNAPYCRCRATMLGYFDGNKFHSLRLGLQVRLAGPGISLQPGEVYRGVLRLHMPGGFHNPDSFDYPRYLRNQGIFAIGQLDPQAPLRLLRPAPWIYREAGALRRRLRVQIETGIPPGPERGVLAALLLGDGAGIDRATSEDFRRCGLTHVLVVSGLHFTFVSLCCYFPFYLLLSLRPAWADSGAARRGALGLALVPTSFYGLLVGLTPSVLRALGGSLLLFLSVAGRWRKDFTSALLLVVVALLAFRPLWIFASSFQLSFLSVAAVYYLGRPWLELLERRLGGRRTWRSAAWKWLLASLYSTVVANLALFPLLAASFHEVSLVSPVANLLLVPLFASFLLPAELGLIFLGGCSPRLGAAGFGMLAHILHPGLRFLALLSRWPGATVLIGSMGILSWIGYLSALAALLFLRRPRLALSCALLAFLAIGWGGLRSVIRPAPQRLSLTMIDVGQGESLILRLPGGDALLIDGGGFAYSDFDVGRNVVLPELLGRGIRRLSAMVLTHPDADHWKGLKYLAERLPVNEFWVSAGVPGHPDFAALEEIIRRRNIPLRVLSRGARWNYQGVQFDVLWPPVFSQDVSDNNHSLVLRVCYGKICFLLTGDIEAEGESGFSQDLSEHPAALLKVAHHGSATSSTQVFLEAGRPQLAFISVGSGNRYHLPNRDVLTRLRALGVKVLRTDVDGQLEAETDGEEIFYHGYVLNPP